MSRDGTTHGGESRVSSRRSWLKLLGASAFASTAASGAVSAGDRESGGDGEDGRWGGFEFDTVVNMKEAGADPTGEEPIDPLLEEHAADNTLLYFPEGRYKLNQFRNYTGTNDDFDASKYYELENFGLVGDGSGKTVLVPRDGQGSAKFGTGYFHRLWFEVRYGRDILVEGFTLDYTAENTGGRFQVVPRGDFVVRDVRVKGVNDVPQGPLLFWVLDEDGHGLVENVRLPDGGDDTSYGANGIFVSPITKGTITFRNCVVVGFPDNGLYASNPSDPAGVRVEGGYYANSNISQVRLGTSRSYVRNARVEVTEPKEVDGPVNMRGVRVADGSGVEIENCDIVMSADAYASGAIVGNHYAGDFSVKNTRIRVDSPFTSWAVFGKSNDIENAAVTMKNVSITGDASSRGAIVLKDRDGTSFENVCIEQTGENRDGVYLTRSDATVRNSVVDVTGEQFITTDSELTTEHVRDEGNCSAPPER